MEEASVSQEIKKLHSDIALGLVEEYRRLGVFVDPHALVRVLRKMLDIMDRMAKQIERCA